MTTRELLYVKTTADTGNISKAAKKLFVTQPSLSQSLQRIEDSIGTKIFVRSPDGLKLTFAGEKYYQMACQVLKIYDDFSSEITDINDLKVGHQLRCHASPRCDRPAADSSRVQCTLSGHLHRPVRGLH